MLNCILLARNHEGSLSETEMFLHNIVYYTVLYFLIVIKADDPIILWVVVMVYYPDLHDTSMNIF